MEHNNIEIYKATMQKMICIARMHRGVFEKNISMLGIHHSQYQLLMYISKRGEVGSQKEIAEKFDISPAAVARTLKSLESEGFIKRSATNNDSRFNKIVLTEKGKEIVEKTREMFIEIDREIFESFSMDDVNAFNNYLDQIRATLINKYEEGCVKNAEEKK